MNAPNILLIVSDQERQRDWIPEGFHLPARQRLMDEGWNSPDTTHIHHLVLQQEEHYLQDSTFPFME